MFFFLSLTVVEIIANSADPGEKQRYVAIHLAIFCLHMYLIRSFLYTMGYKVYKGLQKAISIINFTKRYLNFTADTMI